MPTRVADPISFESRVFATALGLIADGQVPTVARITLQVKGGTVAVKNTLSRLINTGRLVVPLELTGGRGIPNRCLGRPTVAAKRAEIREARAFDADMKSIRRVMRWVRKAARDQSGRPFSSLFSQE